MADRNDEKEEIRDRVGLQALQWHIFALCGHPFGGDQISHPAASLWIDRYERSACRIVFSQLSRIASSRWELNFGRAGHRAFL
jgi:hypothetical protein